MTKLAHFVMAAAALAASANAATLTATPSSITGLPGETIGWGFEFLNDTSAYLVVTDVDFTPTNGVFTGFLPFDPSEIWLLQSFHVVAPGATWTESFSLTLHTGIGPYLVNDFQPIGDISIGLLEFTYDAYTTDPNGPSFNPDDPNNQYGLRAPAAASVTVAESQAVPEPSTMLLAGLALTIITRLQHTSSRRPHID